MEKKIRRENIADHLFINQLEIMGKTKLEVLDTDRWKFLFTITRIQYTDFRDYAISLIMKIFRCNKNKAIGIFNWYWEQFGVKIRN